MNELAHRVKKIIGNDFKVFCFLLLFHSIVRGSAIERGSEREKFLMHRMIEGKTKKCERFRDLISLKLSWFAMAKAYTNIDQQKHDLLFVRHFFRASDRVVKSNYYEILNNKKSSERDEENMFTESYVSRYVCSR